MSRRCCCGCTVFVDHFDRTGPTQLIGDPWDHVNATGEWWLDNTSLYEVAGTGEIIGPRIPENNGYQASFEIIDERPHNVYRIIFGAPEDVGRPLVPPLPGCDCIIAEFYVGDYVATGEWSRIRIYTRAAGVETLVAEKEFPAPSVNWQGGRKFTAHWINTHEDHLFCAFVSHSPYPSLVAVTGLTPPGRYFGAANASGSEELPIRIDDYELMTLTWETLDGELVPCFACTCVCFDYVDDDPEKEKTDRKLYPGKLFLRIFGQCCDPLPIFCDLSACPDALDETIELLFTPDYPYVAFNGWVNQDGRLLCGYPFQFRVECDSAGMLTFTMYYQAYPGAEWAEIVQGGAISLERLEHSCTPIYELWKLTLSSLSGFPCCLGCTTGEYYIEITG